MSRNDRTRSTRGHWRVVFFIGVPLLLTTATAFMVMNRPVTAYAYVQWWESEEHGAKAIQRTDNAIYSVQYKSLEYIAIKERHALPDGTGAFASALSTVDTSVDAFTLTITGLHEREPMREENAGAADYYSRAGYYALGIEHDLVLTQGNDTLPCRFAHTERSFGISPDLHVLLAFAKADPDGPELLLHVNDRALDNTGVVLRMDPSAWEKAPSLRIP